MKRSEINKTIQIFENFLFQMGVKLPPFFSFTPGEWLEKGSEYDEIRDNMLGWDVTDYGLGNFRQTGLALCTIRNGNLKKKDLYPKTYAEKLIMSCENQISPMHFHYNKMEDIINRGGGNLMMHLYNSSAKGEFAPTDITVVSDGRKYVVPAGKVIRLRPGESITLAPGQYHEFWAEEGMGPVLIGEVSAVNDDNTDNRFHKPLARFSVIQEDEAPYRLLCSEYPKIKDN